MLRMVIFDMAGTTVNENKVVYKCVQQAIGEAGIDVTLDQVMAVGAGKEKSQAISSVLKAYAHTEDESLISSIYQRFLILLEKAYATLDVAPANNAEQVFSLLRSKNIRVVLNTGYNRTTAESLLAKLNWKKGVEVDALVASSDVARPRPFPDMIRHAMKLFDIDDPADVAKVGDSSTDVEEGRNAGCGLSIGITTGAHTQSQLQAAHPDYIINNLAELMPLLESRMEAHFN